MELDDKIYDSWTSYPRGRLFLGAGGSSRERIWTRILPDGSVGIDNDPLWTKYRYQDIVNSGSGNPTIIYRRWSSKIWFWYRPTSTIGIREKKIYKSLIPHGSLTFMDLGTGFVLLKEDNEEALHIVEALLSQLNYVENIEIGGDMRSQYIHN